MQVSIYLKPALVKKIDKRAKTANKSRSQVIQTILEEDLGPTEKKRSVWDDLCGIFTEEEADELLNTIRSSRIDSDRFKP